MALPPGPVFWALAPPVAALLLLPVPVASAGDGRWYKEPYEYNFLEVSITILMLSLALAFEAGWHYLTHRAERFYQYGDLQSFEDSGGGSARASSHIEVRHTRLSKELIHRAGGEFMILGFLAFCIFICNMSGGFEWCTRTFHEGELHMPFESSQWLHLAEFTHIQLFITMLAYFALISRAVKGSEDKIKLWEKMSMRRIADMGGGAQTLRRPSSLSTMDTDLDSYTCWRQYFVARIVRWQERRPAIFLGLLDRLGIDATADDASARFQAVLDKEFSFSAYLALAVASGMRDSIQIHWTTWFVVLLLFGIFALVHWFAHIALAPLTPGFIVVAVALLAIMKLVVLRKRRRIEQLMHSGGAATDGASPVRRGRGADSFGQSSPAGGRAVIPATAQSAKMRRFHERHKTEMVMLRMLQIVLFLISYVFACFLLNTNFLLQRPWIWLFVMGVFAALFVSLACVLPAAVPLFLAMLAMPPYVDEENFETFCTLLLQNRARSELRMWRELSRSRRFQATGSGFREDPLAVAAKVLSEDGSEDRHASEGRIGEREGREARLETSTKEGKGKEAQPEAFAREGKDRQSGTAVSRAPGGPGDFNRTVEDGLEISI